MTTKTIIICALAVIAVGIVFFLLTMAEEGEFVLAPQEASAGTAGEIGTGSSEVGTGWSTNETPQLATKEAVDMALKGKTQKHPDFAAVFASSGSDMTAILRTAKKLLGEKIRIFGGTSDSRAVMTDKGFIRITERGYQTAQMEGQRGLTIMTVTSKDIVFGVGSAGLSDFTSPQEMSKTAILNAINNAGKTENERPRIILLSSTIGIEEEVLEGIEEAVGKNVPMLGGTVGGPAAAVFGEDAIYDEGVSIAAIYTDLPVGWTFEGGFDVTDKHTGIVTKTEGQAIVEIDNRPALDVYDEWLGGDIERLYKQVGKPDIIRDLLTLHPLYRRYRSPSGQDYFLFSHPWPKDDEMKDRSVSTSTKIKVGERLHLSHGTWETLVNRVGNLPINAKIHGEIGVNTKPILAVGFICGGVMGAIPETEREKLPFLINHTNNNGPFIANFTWGEQGYFPGVGCKHGNLLTSFLVIGSQSARE